MLDMLDKSALDDAREPFKIWVLNGDGMQLKQQLRQGLLRLQGAPEKIAPRLHAALGIDLPVVPNRFNKGEKGEIIWLGPKKWLIRAPAPSSVDIQASLSQSLGDIPCLMADVSHQYITLELSGPRANSLLQRCCSIDVDGPIFKIGSAVRTLFGRVPVLLQYKAKGPTYDLYIDQSLARFSWDWLAALSQNIIPNDGTL